MEVSSRTLKMRIDLYIVLIFKFIIKGSYKNMQLIDLQHFKTKKCTQTHNDLNYSPSHFHCEMFHSKHDKRRNPLMENKKELFYSEVYIEDFYCNQMASNFVEYLYHPNIYKTIQCKYRNNVNYQPGLQYSGKCPNLYCPYLHQNQDVTSLQRYRNLTVANYLQEAPSQLKITQGVIKMLKLSKTQFSNTFKNEVALVKQQLKKVQNCEIPKKQPQKIQRVETVQIQNFQNKLKQNIKGSEIHENWYVPYQQFYYGQKLTIIEDRHHEFKNFRDIVTNSITQIVMKYITAFLNSQGGVLYIGIDDSSIVYGFQITQSQFDKFLLSIDKEGKFNMYPPLMPQKYAIRRIPVINSGSKRSKQLWVIQIKIIPIERQRKNKILHTYNRQCFMRMNASTHKLDAMDLFQYNRLNDQQKQENKNKKQQLQTLYKSFDNKNKMLQIDTQELISMREIINKMGQKIESILIEKKKK